MSAVDNVRAKPNLDGGMMNLRKTLLAFTILLIALGRPLVSQQPATASIQGVVTQVVTNSPIGNANVELRAASGGTAIDSITTAVDGVFTFTGVRPGQYRLIAT